MYNSKESETINLLIMPELGIIIEEFYNILKTNKSDPLLMPGRVYKLFKDNLFKLRILGGHSLAHSMGHPQTTYVILKRFDELICSFREEKRFFGSDYSLPRNQVLKELASIKEFAGLASSQILHKFK
jgi:hypothetical protein